ncbi:MAG: hypothetical protein Q7K98_05340 [Candidatus Omnitrophota bacterium]|nr:hypothetical protein [Candidatus Omnitrophota bacterium]
MLKFIFYLFLLSLCCVRDIFGAETSTNSAQASEAGAAFEQALKNVEAQKAEERKALTLKCKTKLAQLIDNWLSEKEAQKKPQLNQVIDQNWEKLPYEYNFTTLHYDYYLRGFDYNILSSEIKETESLTAPIKAQSVIIEKVYAEKYHTPDISNVDPYFFTVTTVITLNLEFRQDNFVIIGVDNKITKIENDCPDRIKRFGRNLF